MLYYVFNYFLLFLDEYIERNLLEYETLNFPENREPKLDYLVGKTGNCLSLSVGFCKFIWEIWTTNTISTVS